MSVIILISVIVVLGYYLSLRIHPTIRCKRCYSGSRNYDLMYSHSERARRACPDCRGSGRQKRLGVRLFIRSR